jgi:hypothetical protein
VAGQVTWTPVNDGVPVVLRADEAAPWRYVFVCYYSPSGGSGSPYVEVRYGQEPSGALVARVYANTVFGVPIKETLALCVVMPSTSSAPAASDQVIFSASTAHLAGYAGSV